MLWGLRPDDSRSRSEVGSGSLTALVLEEVEGLTVLPLRVQSPNDSFYSMASMVVVDDYQVE